MIITDAIDLATYHASEFVSHSKMRTFDDLGAYAYKARHLTAENTRKRTDAMDLGQAFETFVQDPTLFAATYKEAVDVEGKADDVLLAEVARLGVLTEDEKPFTKRHGAATVHLAIMQARGEYVMTRKDMMRLERMAASFDANLDAQAVIRGARKQVTLRDDFAGCDMLPGIQSRPDWYHDTGEAPDLKTTSKFSAFDREVVANGYNSQAAMIDIISGVRREHPLLVVESEWPWRVQVVDLPHELLEAGAEWCRRVLDEMRACYAADEWKLCESRRTASVPRYMRKEGW